MTRTKAATGIAKLKKKGSTRFTGEPKLSEDPCRRAPQTANGRRNASRSRRPQRTRLRPKKTTGADSTAPITEWKPQVESIPIHSGPRLTASTAAAAATRIMASNRRTLRTAFALFGSSSIGASKIDRDVNSDLWITLSTFPHRPTSDRPHQRGPKGASRDHPSYGEPSVHRAIRGREKPVSTLAR